MKFGTLVDLTEIIKMKKNFFKIPIIFEVTDGHLKKRHFCLFHFNAHA